MQQAIDLALKSIDMGGGPFGAVVVRNGKVIGRGHNRVVMTCDPTAHAEMVAIRDACHGLGSHVLADAELYTSCEPCPMCLSAIYWARIPKVFFGASRYAAAAADFSDSLIYDELSLPIPQRKVAMQACMSDEANAIFAAWKDKMDRIPY